MPDKEATTAPASLADWIFQRTVEDIAQRAYSEDPVDRYRLLGIASLLRKLLLDRQALLSVARSKHPQLPPQFRFVPYIRRPLAEAPWTGLRASMVGDPERGTAPDDFSQQEFLRLHLGEVDGVPVTATDVIYHFARIEGGTNIGRPTTNAERALAALAPQFASSEIDGYLSVLADLGQIVVQAVKPLYSEMSTAIPRAISTRSARHI